MKYAQISVILFLLLREHVRSAQIAPITATLPEFMIDFEVNAENGDLATVSPVTNKAYLFRHEDLFQTTPDYVEVSVCQTPLSISYKMYLDEATEVQQAYYAVACPREMSIYVLDARDFSIIATPTISGLKSSKIISSKNPQDPFFYYFYGSGYNAFLAAFDVREMVDRGKVWRDSVGDGAITADGQIAYIRETSSSYVKSIERTGTYWSMDAPSFEILQSRYRRSATAVPDTVSQMTAIGTNIFSNTLGTELTSLDYTVSCWANSSQYIFGFVMYEERYKKPKITGIAATSSIAFDSIGENVLIPEEFFSAEEPRIPGRHQFRKELQAIDTHGELVMAYGDRISIIPYPCFRLNSLSLAPNTTDIFVRDGVQVVKFNLDGETGGDGLNFAELPRGVTFDSSKHLLSWTPTDDQVGRHNLIASLKIGDNHTCQFSFTFNVSHPSMKLPFAPSKLVINEGENTAVAYVNEQVYDYYSYYNYRYTSRVAIIPLQNRTSHILTKDLDFQLSDILVSENRLVAVEVASSDRRGVPEVAGRFVYVFSLHDFEHLKTIYVPHAGLLFYSYSELRFDIKGNHLQVQDSRDEHFRTVRTYDLQTFLMEEQDFFYTIVVEDSTTPMKEGVVRNGILYDPVNKKPALVLDPGPYWFGGSTDNNHNVDWLHKIPKFLVDEPMVAFERANIFLQVQVNAHHYHYDDFTNDYDDYDDEDEDDKDEDEDEDDGDHLNRYDDDFWDDDRTWYYDDDYRYRNDDDRYDDDDSDGEDVVIWVIDAYGYILGAKKVAIDVHGSWDSALLTTGVDHVYVTYMDSLYWYSASEFVDFSPEVNGNQELHFAPNQTEFCINGGKQWEFQHTVLGGEPPFEFFDDRNLFSDQGIARMDEASGVVVFDGNKFKEEALELLVMKYDNNTYGIDALRVLRKASILPSEPSFYLSGCLEPDEIPVSHEVTIKVVDQKASAASITYYVHIGVRYDELEKLLNDRVSTTHENIFNRTTTTNNSISAIARIQQPSKKSTTESTESSLNDSIESQSNIKGGLVRLDTLNRDEIDTLNGGEISSSKPSVAARGFQFVFCTGLFSALLTALQDFS